MLDLATINPDDVAKGVQLAGEAVDAVERKFPGIGLWLNDKAMVKHGKRMMEAVSSLRAHGQEIGLDQEIADALIANTLKGMGADENVAKCITYALPAVEDPSLFDSLDDEKAEYWRMHAEKATSEDMRQLLGAILAGEVNKSGAVSKRTLSIVADMSREDAVVFQKLCAVTIGGLSEVTQQVCDPKLLVIETECDSYCHGFVSFEELANMESLGLVKLNSVYVLNLESSGLYTVVGDKEYAIMKTGDQGILRFGNAAYTKYGNELARLFSLGAYPRLFEILDSVIDKKQFMIMEIDKSSKPAVS